MVNTRINAKFECNARFLYKIKFNRRRLIEFTAIFNAQTSHILNDDFSIESYYNLTNATQSPSFLQVCAIHAVRNLLKKDFSSLVE